MLIDDDRKFHLVVPTRGETRFLKRALDYLRARKFQGNIVLSDDSDGEHRAFVQRCPSEYSDLWIDVHAHEPSTRFLVKLASTLEALKGEFVMLCGHDDFIVPPALEQCVEHLDHNPDHSAARGRIAMFTLKRSSNPGSPPAVTLTWHPMREYLQEQPLQRMLDHIERYSATFYSVHRRELLLESMRRTERDTKNVIFFQYLSSATTAHQGKIACLDSMFYVRQGHGDSWSGQLRASRDPEHWPFLITSPNFSRYYLEFRDSLVQLAQSGAQEDAGQLASRIDAAAIGLFQRGFSGIEGENPPENAFLKRLTAAGTAENSEVMRIAGFCAGYPDTYS